MTLTLRQAGVAVRFLVLMTVLLGVVYPTTVWVVGRLVADRADGAFVTDSSGTVVGSLLIGQEFQGPQWFQPRPSAAGSGYDALSSGGSNLALDSPDLVDAIRARQQLISVADGAGQIPPDAVTASGSGLDPDISPQYARIQVARVARVRGLDPATVSALVDEHVAERTLGFIGEPRVNVLELNLALEQLS